MTIPTTSRLTKNDDTNMEYRTRLGPSWLDSRHPPEQHAVSLSVQGLAERLEEIALELHAAHHCPETTERNILVALHLLDVLQAEIE